jgi:hypothetical protein
LAVIYLVFFPPVDMSLSIITFTQVGDILGYLRSGASEMPVKARVMCSHFSPRFTTGRTMAKRVTS